MNRNEIVFLIFLSVLCLSVKAQPWKDHGRLEVSKENHHYLAYQDGKPFFWLADTGWEMLHRLNREEIETYLENRKEKGFNVIQTVLISEFIHSDKLTNYYNDSIFINENPENPALTQGNNPENATEYDYWDHVDFAIKTAESKGLYLALLPTWGEWVTPRTDKALFNSKDQAYSYGWFIGNRYQNSPNIIWILGGDRHPDERPNGLELWRSMAEGIADGTNNTKNLDGKADYSSTLMTYHCFESSSKWFHQDEWIDFHTWGSYHAEVNNTRSYLAAIADWNLLNPKPTLNSEPNYEGHGINYAIDDNGVFTSTDVRMAAYWSVFSGAAGFTYGAQPIWQFNDDTRKKLSSKTLTNWKEALDLPGAFQVGILKKLMESHPMNEMVPDQSLIVAGQGECGSYSVAIRGKSVAYIYIPTGNKTTVKMGIISGEKVKATWFDPRSGQITVIGEFKNSGEQSFEVPGMSKELAWLKSGRGCDWVLVIEKAPQ
ncbi:MAG: glycoside hydrolase family 140 protein [Bacteroidia bacterium]